MSFLYRPNVESPEKAYDPHNFVQLFSTFEIGLSCCLSPHINVAIRKQAHIWGYQVVQECFSTLSTFPTNTTESIYRSKDNEDNA
jgi:hypothetical protein